MKTNACSSSGTFSGSHQCGVQLAFKPQISQAGRDFTTRIRLKATKEERQVREWAQTQISGKVAEAVLKMCLLKNEFLLAYEHPETARTSNGLDRLMDYQDRVLYAMRYFHGNRIGGVGGQGDGWAMEFSSI